MTFRDAIAEADKIRPNVIGEEIKAGWLMDLETDVAETMQVKRPESVWPEDRDLLAPDEKCRFYVLWLCAMIDWDQLDTEQYAVDKVMYEQEMKEFRAWWRRSHVPVIKSSGARWKS